MAGTKSKTKYTKQTIQNFGFDEVFLMPGRVIWGYDSANQVLRRVKVDTNGKLVASFS